MAVKFTNNAYSTLAGSINSAVTSLSVQTGHGARFPSLSGSDYFYATLTDTSNNIEIVKVTARATDAFTIVRAQDNTTAKSYSSGDRVELRVTAALMTDLAAERLALAGNQVVTAGFRVTAYSGGTVSGSTYTPDAYNHNYQYYTNNGAHTLAAPSNDCAIDILITNGASAGAITFSGFTVASGNTGDALTTTNTNKFLVSIRRVNSVATYTIKALQ